MIDLQTVQVHHQYRSQTVNRSSLPGLGHEIDQFLSLDLSLDPDEKMIARIDLLRRKSLGRVKLATAYGLDLERQFAKAIGNSASQMSVNECEQFGVTAKQVFVPIQGKLGWLVQCKGRK